MKATKSNLFVAVESVEKGEYLLKLEIHEPEFRGWIHVGVTESGFVKKGEFSNYIHSV